MPLPPSPTPQPLPFIRLTMSAGQAMNTATLTTMSFDQPKFYNGWPTQTGPITTITVPWVGLYLLKVHDVDFADTGVAISTGIRRVGRELNGGAATRRMGQSIVGAGGSATNPSVLSYEELIYLGPGVLHTGGLQADTIKIIVNQTSGGSLTVGINSVVLELKQFGTQTWD
jgi:hypothetical protein